MMTTSRYPEKPSTDGKTRPKKGSRAPLGRRLRYLAQDTRYAVKKAGRRVADPVRDARSKRASEAALAKAEKAGESKRSMAPKAKPAEQPKRGNAAAAKAEKSEKRQEEKRREPRAERKAPRRSRRPRLRRPGTERKPRAERAPRGERKGRAGRRGWRPGTARRARKPRAGRRVRRPGTARRHGTRARRRIPRPSGRAVATAITNFGERASKLIRGALAPLAIPVIALAALGRRGLGCLAREATPLRAALATTALAAILLAVSQFVDYRGVAVGVPEYAAYANAEQVASAPQVDREPAGSAHAYVLVPAAALAIGLLFLVARGRWQLGRAVSLLGLFGIAITLVVDRPAGLDESAQAIAYSGVEAQLIEGFWAQLFAAGVLVAGGLLVSRYARSAPRRASRPRRRAARVGTARARAA